MNRRFFLSKSSLLLGGGLIAGPEVLKTLGKSAPLISEAEYFALADGMAFIETYWTIQAGPWIEMLPPPPTLGTP